MNANGFTIDHLRFKRLNRETVQSWRTIQEHRVTPGYFVENIPDFGRLALDHLFSAAHCVDVPQIFEPANDERLEEDQRHLFWQPALIQLELRTNDNYRAAGVIDAFA